MAKLEKPTLYIVRIKTKEKVSGINKLLGYKTPEIVVPEEIIFDV